MFAGYRRYRWFDRASIRRLLPGAIRPPAIGALGLYPKLDWRALAARPIHLSEFARRRGRLLPRCAGYRTRPGRLYRGHVAILRDITPVDRGRDADAGRPMPSLRAYTASRFILATS
jgi:hypothetical protein